MDNLCIQCGKPRIDGKTWKEKVGAFEVTNTQTICPDPACQKLVDKAISDRKAKMQSLIKEKEARLAKAKLASVTTA